MYFIINYIFLFYNLIYCTIILTLLFNSEQIFEKQNLYFFL